jgi:hypothetical protein
MLCAKANRDNRASRLLLIAIVVAMLVSWEQLLSAGQRPDALIVCPHAKNMRLSQVVNTVHLSYNVRDEFPAAATIRHISSELQKRGWRAIPYDVLTPKQSVPLVQVWQHFPSVAGSTVECNYEWIGNWRNQSGDVVRYILLYRYPQSGVHDLMNLEVRAMYAPAFVVKRIPELTAKGDRAAIEELKREGSQNITREINQKLKKIESGEGCGQR